MKKLLIIGGGTAGTMMANKLRKALKLSEWEITVVDKHKDHYYQPGFLYIPFGKFTLNDVKKPKANFFPKGVNVIFSDTEKINPNNNNVVLADGRTLTYDYLIIATGTETRPDQTQGLQDKLWYKKIFDFYTGEGAVELGKFLEKWKGGKMLVCITELPFKCPVAPIEFVFLADTFFSQKGIRNKVDISFVTPLSGAFTKPIATKLLNSILKEKNINLVPDFYIEKVDNDQQKIISYDERELDFDLLVTIPLNMGDRMIERSGMGNDMNFVPTNKHTLKSVAHDNIFVIGDATDLPTSKAGSVAHFASDILYENILDAIEGKPLKASFDGHANCFIETGHGKAALIDFNYDVEPLPGNFPIPAIGPFKLLRPTRINHLGKKSFKWIYWNLLIKGREFPLIDGHMSMRGKKTPA